MDDINLLRTAVTVLAFIVYVGIVWWSYTPNRADRFNAAAQIPFADDDLPKTGKRNSP